MVAYWKENGGMSRHGKFRHFFSTISPGVSVEELAQAAVDRFTEHSLAGYAQSEPCFEALVLARHAGAARSVVVSGALETELEQVFAEKSIRGLFSAVLGSPTPKQELMRRVIERRGCRAADAILIGDGAADFRAARALGVHFVYLDQFSEWRTARQHLHGAPGVSWAPRWDDLLAALGIEV
jgi:phosphoglycolate phosphatase-like HAD superfamily hydrolase